MNAIAQYKSIKNSISLKNQSLLLIKDQMLILCYGGGVDSTALLIGLRDLGIIPDLITFANTGGEKPETYRYVRMMDTWLKENGFPLITWCRHKTLDSTPYRDLSGNCLDNETLPSLAFGLKSCSIKWKQSPQDYIVKGCSRGKNKCTPHPLWLKAQAIGIKPIKFIGYDSSPADIRRSKKNKLEDADFIYQYPLQEWGWTREHCIARILEEGLPVPIKSACYFCPASKKWELWWLAGNHPNLFMKSLAIEHKAMIGKHSRWGSDECTYDKDWLEFVNLPADKWPATDITVGLSRNFSWNHWARENGIVCKKTGDFIGNKAYCRKMAKQLQLTGGNANDARTQNIKIRTQ